MLQSILLYKCIFETLLSVLLGIYPEMELLGCLVTQFFEEPPSCFLQQLYHLAFPPTVQKDSGCFTSLSALVVFYFLYNSHPFGCEMVSHCSFDLHFPVSDVSISPCSYWPCVHLYIFFGGMCIQILLQLFAFLYF